MWAGDRLFVMMEDEMDVEAELGELMKNGPYAYSDSDYWNQRYTRQNGTFEWYRPWGYFSSTVLPFLDQKDRCLNIGCGNSQMSLDLVKDGFIKVVSIDISQVVIDKMKEMFSENDRVEWIQGDCMKLPFENDCFDVVVDKGTLDALVCSIRAVLNVKSMLSEVCRVLKSGGVFIEISLGADERKGYFERCDNCWKRVHIKVINDERLKTSHTVNIFRKD
jgi:ubiquinone/menaquinone biosynthesis C-methylase UbiE